MQKLMIADSSEAYISALEATLGDQYRIQTCADGETALELLRSFQPDILIINLLLPYTDGLTVLQQTDFHPPIILAITNHLSAYVESSISELGVDYTMISPSIRSLCLRLQDLVTCYTHLPESQDPQAIVMHHLHMLNFATHRDGYRQLLAAIPLFAKNPQQFMTKELYPAVAKICGSRDGRAVEHSIRKAIQAAWQQRDNAIWRKYFTPGPRGRICCPSNKEFICRLAELMNTQSL